MSDWFPFLIYITVAAITPGPNNILALSQSGRLGIAKTLPFNWGVLVGALAISYICLFLIFFMRDFVPIILKPLVIIGAAYIIYLAWKVFTSPAKLQDSKVVAGFRTGVLLQFVNPKAYIFAFLSFEGYILPMYGQDVFMLSLAALCFAFSGLVGTLLWSVFGATFKALFTKFAKITNTIMALLLLYCAVSLFF